MEAPAGSRFGPAIGERSTGFASATAKARTTRRPNRAGPASWPSAQAKWQVPRSRGHLVINILQRPAPAADGVDRGAALQEQSRPALVKRGRVLDADAQEAILRCQIKSGQDAGIEEVAGQLFRRIAVDLDFFGPIL